MRYLGMDWGEKRIGLSFGEDDPGVATPLPAATAPKKRARLAAIAEVIEIRKVEAIVVGYPLNMDGSAGFQAGRVDAFIAELERRFRLPVHRIDERLTSDRAAGDLRSAGRRQDDRRSGKLDSRAATLLLQDFLDARNTRNG